MTTPNQARYCDVAWCEKTHRHQVVHRRRIVEVDGWDQHHVAVELEQIHGVFSVQLWLHDQKQKPGNTIVTDTSYSLEQVQVLARTLQVLDWAQVSELVGALAGVVRAAAGDQGDVLSTTNSTIASASPDDGDELDDRFDGPDDKVQDYDERSEETDS